MIDEIQSGLKNAIERGNSLDEAIKTFVNAGYNPVEVKEAANALGYGASNITSQTSSSSNTKPAAFQNQNTPQIQQPSQQQFNSLPSQGQQSPSQSSQNIFSPSNTYTSPFGSSFSQQAQQSQQQKSSSSDSSYSYSPVQKQKNPKKKKVIVLIILLLLLIGAIITVILFKENILGLFGQS
ncbi:hypothetical protein HYW75_02135 [Candidatus Pacearchaeota archaeon]|nr:hypothetical protein [Candidatus Pacearchaeota archaeon]